MQNYLSRILKLQERKVQDEERVGVSFDFHSLIKWVRGEIDEVESEIKENNSVYLEDELGDIFWTYMRLLYSLEKDSYIDINNVFKRVESKYSERIEAVEQDISWNEIKVKQKADLKKEHDVKYNS